jgi:carboxyl-terminal processing protease
VTRPGVSVHRHFIASAIAVALAGAAPAFAQAGSAAGPPAALPTFDKAWELVRDTHFDPALNGVDWARVRDELRPRAAAAQSVAELRAVIQSMLDRLGQSHFTLLPSDAVTPGDAADPPDQGTVGFDVRLLGDQVVATRVEAGGPADEAGVAAGWVVRAIDRRTVADLLSRLPTTLPARLRQVEAWRLVSTRLRGPIGSPVQVDFVDGTGALLQRSVVRRRESGDPVAVGSLPTFHVRVSRDRVRGPQGADIGIIAFNVWMTPVDAQFGAAVDAYRDADGLVIDLRGNPGGFAAMLMGIAGYLFEEPVVLGTMKTRATTLQFTANPRRVNAEGARLTPYRGPVAILVDAMTGSASECFAGGLQALGRARIFGQPTMGQALPALFDRLPNGDVLLHAYGDFLTPGGVSLEGRGVQPDEVVPLEREDLLAGRDRAMLAARAWIASRRR